MIRHPGILGELSCNFRVYGAGVDHTLGSGQQIAGIIQQLLHVPQLLFGCFQFTPAVFQFFHRRTKLFLCSFDFFLPFANLVFKSASEIVTPHGSTNIG